MKLIHKLAIFLSALTFASPGAEAAPQSVRDLRYEITDTAIVFPESLQADVHRMQQNWYLRNYTVLDTVGTSNIPATDEVYISRLQLTPTTIEMPFNNVVKQNIEKYVVDRRQLVETMLGLSLYYMPIFEEALEKEDLPLELRNLPIIESALNPNAVSRAGATGLWQFMLPTARGLGMEISTLVDERRDPIISSENAARYLRQLYEMFHDWGLAIAAYNCGPGNVSKALTRAGATESEPKDFWDIYYYLPSETRGYLPGFIGATYAMNYYADHGISPALAKRPILTDTVHVNERLHFSAISNVLDIPVDELRVLNPQYRKDVIPGDVRPYALRLPSQLVYNFLMYQDSIRSASQSLGPRAVVEVGGSSATVSADGSYREVTKWHKVRRGETIAKIAQKYGVSTRDIKKWNGLRSNKLKSGAKLKIIVRELIPEAREQQSGSSSNNNGVDIVINTPEVVPADTTTVPADSIAPAVEPVVPAEVTEVSAEDSDVEESADGDAEVESDTAPEQEETIAEAEPEPAKPAAPQTRIHRVKKGENLYGIAKKYGTTVKRLQELNNLSDSRINIGQRLKIPAK